MTSSAPVLEARSISVEVPGRVLIDALQLDARPGELIAVLGQNGCGKTLMMLTLAGLRNGARGRISLYGTDIGEMPRRQVATRLALLPQHSDDSFPASVLETVLTGRHPHIGRFRWESADDLDIAGRALDTMGIGDMRNRDVLTLSGGERRRLAIAQVLAQSPSVYLLDEPTNHLDPQHQVDVLREFRDRADAGATVIATLHDANLAVRYADRCLLLYGDGNWNLGEAADIIDAETLSGLYDMPMEAVPWRAGTLYVPAGPAN